MHTPAFVIQQKRDGKELTREQIFGFIQGLESGAVAVYQATALLVAIFFQGMSLAETIALTEAMLESGDRYRLDHIPGPKSDKHSTGGVGDKVSIILAPLAAACGLKVPMMSGRGLGHSGGTLDKLESISGFDVRLPLARFEEVLRSVGCAMIGQTERIVPADKKLYALRDVTGTVECIPLIVASILSKKLAEGAESLVLDVKVGSGAFMKSKEQARKLAKTLTQVAGKMGLRCRAVLTDMNQPLGYAVGNGLEILESIEVLRNSRTTRDRPICGIIPECAELSSGDLKELTIQLCAQMLELAGVSRRVAEGRKLAHSKLADGSAWQVFQNLVQAQGGSLDQINHPEKLPRSRHIMNWQASKRGYIAKMDTAAIGRAVVNMGGGRKTASDPVNPGVGIVFHKKLGAKVQPGDTIASVFVPETPDPAEARQRWETLSAELQDTLEITGARKPVPKLIVEVIGK